MVLFLFRELGVKLDLAPTLLCDNKSAIFMSKNPTTTPRSRHIKISYYFVQELIAKGALKIEYVPLALQYANGFTKVLGSDGFCQHQDRHRVVPIPAGRISNLPSSSLLGLRKDVKLSGQPNTQIIT